jgi:hypothetical protein
MFAVKYQAGRNMTRLNGCLRTELPVLGCCVY